MAWKNRKVIVLSVSIAASFAATSAIADGKELLEHCRIAQQYIKTGQDHGGMLPAGHCIGYAEGSAQTLNIVSGHVDPLARVCLPSKLSRAQMVDALVTYLESHPKQLNSPEPVLAILAFTAAFPCPVK